MPEDIFIEVKSIEEQADLLLAQARADAEKAGADARTRLADIQDQCRRRFQEQSARLRKEDEQRLSRDRAAVDEEFDRRKARLEDIAQKQTDKLAEWVVSRFMGSQA
jgi:vacuolar-type H+-ATPase subunit H